MAEATKRRRRKKREPVTPERIVATALRLMDEEGIEAVTMRRIASELDVEATALYHHMPNKDAILDGVAEILEQEVLPFPSEGTWRDIVRDAMLRVYDSLERHPAAAPLLARSTRSAPSGRRRLECLMEALYAAGFEPGDAVVVYHMTAAYLIGFNFGATMSAVMPRIPAEALDEYPALRASGPLIGQWPREEFARGIERILATFEPSEPRQGLHGQEQS
jgi:AcrR family transcriptional regulator